ncbi:hypothetical protein [Halorientalis regularis]|uniref:hypothetical protein n=1 Tax=Halorientalis regularis TaxID=660518 RepID=UPI001587A998|nr:hypothetical protein [Halorientalis regularis]
MVRWRVSGVRPATNCEESESYTLLAGPEDGCLPSGDYRVVDDNYFREGQSGGITVEIP